MSEHNWYEQGAISFREGMGPFCPVVTDGTQSTSEVRSAWYNGYYDALMASKHDWWHTDRWALRNRFETMPGPSAPLGIQDGRHQR